MSSAEPRALRSSAPVLHLMKGFAKGCGKVLRTFGRRAVI